MGVPTLAKIGRLRPSLPNAGLGPPSTIGQASPKLATIGLSGPRLARSNKQVFKQVPFRNDYILLLVIPTTYYY